MMCLSRKFNLVLRFTMAFVFCSPRRLSDIQSCPVVTQCLKVTRTRHDIPLFRSVDGLANRSVGRETAYYLGVVNRFTCVILR